MCGVLGFVNLDGAPADAEVAGAMLDIIQHRGPDDRGIRCVSVRGGAPDTALGVQRLKILDLSDRGHQPMTGADDAVSVAFNGAIYNAAERRAELTRGGYRFRSTTDTEVILALYERDGPERLLEHLDGMFALAIADTRRGMVLVARDRLGIKPLYWTQVGGTVMFASEAKAFLAHPAFRAEIRAVELDELLAFRYVAGEHSLLEGVRHVLPGHYLSITPGGATQSRYWSIPDHPEKPGLSRQEAVDRLGWLLDHSVRSHLQSDVPVGCQLSGGIDSSVVTVYARAHRADVSTYSIVFDQPGFSEARWIEAASAKAGADSHRFVFDETAFMRAIRPATWHMDQPISHPNSLALWLLAERARGSATVLLTGEGADEVFGGYRRAVQAHHGSSGSGALDPADAFVRATQFHSASRLAKLRPGSDLGSAIEKRRAIFHDGHGDHLSNCLKYDMRTHLVDVLMRQDKMMMAHGIENRVPFLGAQLVEFARTLSAEHLVGPSSSGGAPEAKSIVKTLARRHFDEAFVGRRKSAFNLPLAQYFRSAAFVELMEDSLLPGMAARGLVDVTVVRRWWRRALSAPATTEGFWIVVALELWAQAFIDRRR